MGRGGMVVNLVLVTWHAIRVDNLMQTHSKGTIANGAYNCGRRFEQYHPVVYSPEPVQATEGEGGRVSIPGPVGKHPWKGGPEYQFRMCRLTLSVGS